MKIQITEKNFFIIGVVISLVVHCFLVVGLYQAQQEQQELETLLKEKKRDMDFANPDKKFKPVNVKKILDEIDPTAKIREKSRPAQTTLPIFKEQTGLPNQFRSLDRRPQKITGLKVSRQVAVPVLKSGKINSPAYVTYYQIVRDRIRQMAYSNYEQLHAGDVYMTFVLLANGELKQIKVVEENSTTNTYLHDVGMQSVNQASPFPAFPENLKYPELTFNMLITFRFDEQQQ